MREKNPWNEGWRLWVGLLSVFIPIVALIYFFVTAPKLELCATYYRELSKWSCLMSNYGLPQPGVRK